MSEDSKEQEPYDAVTQWSGEIGICPMCESRVKTQVGCHFKCEYCGHHESCSD